LFIYFDPPKFLQSKNLGGEKKGSADPPVGGEAGSYVGN